jgi:hypothetical protein
MTTRLRNPLERLKRWQRGLWIAAAPLLALLALWALRPMSIAPIASPTPTFEPRDREHPSAPSSAPDIDPRIFAVALWNPPPPPEKPAETALAQAAPPKPLNVQLIGIITENGQSKAALYDADSDRLLIVADGERVRDHVVHIVGGPKGMVELSDGRSTRTLTLRPEKEAAPS